MTRKDAFEFLELPESASRADITTRIADKLEYFEELGENAPSDFLRRINTQHAAKLKRIQQEFFPWSAIDSGSDIYVPQQPADAAPPAVEEELPYTIPVIIAPGAKLPAPPVVKGPPAWLIVHTEHKKPTAFPLRPGKNYIGRKLQPSLHPFIVLDDDPFVSRVHAVVYAEEGALPAFYIVDSASANNGSESKNGTYVNGNKTRVSKKETLVENDTIQIGTTKLVLKYNDRALPEIIGQLEKAAYIPTVVIDK